MSSYLCIPKGLRTAFVVIAKSDNDFDEFHGPFKTRKEAEAHSRYLAHEYEDYTALTIGVMDVIPC